MESEPEKVRHFSFYIAVSLLNQQQGKNEKKPLDRLHLGNYAVLSALRVGGERRSPEDSRLEQSYLSSIYSHEIFINL